MAGKELRGSFASFLPEQRRTDTEL
jgi:hypothetical protein